MNDEPIDNEVTEDRQAVRSALMRDRCKPKKIAEKTTQDDGEIDWIKY